MPRNEILKCRHGVEIKRIPNPDASQPPIFTVEDTHAGEPARNFTDELSAWMYFDERVADKLRRART